MKRLLTLLFTVVCAASAFAGDGVIRRPSKSIPGQYIVVLNDDAPGKSEIANEMTRRFGTRTRIVFAGFPGFSIEATEKVAQAISRDPRVAWVEENAVAELSQVANTTTRPFPPGWALDRTDQSLPPLDGYGGPGCQTASGIRLYILDTGISDVDGTEFGTRLRHLYKARSGWPYTDASAAHHGSGVASVAGGRRHGLARSAEIVNVKVHSGGGSMTAMQGADYTIDGITRVDIDHYNLNLNNPAPRPAVVNMSLYFSSLQGVTEDKMSAVDLAVVNSVKGCNAKAWASHTDFDGVTSMREVCTSFNANPAAYGLTYVVGAGNDNTTIDGSPARLGNDTIGTVTVGATKMMDEWTTDWRADFSNYGSEIDIWAPGTDVDAARRSVLNGVITQKMSGTSIASPLVAGQVARLALTYYWYTSQQIEQQLKTTATSQYLDGSPVIKDVLGGLLMRYTPGKCRS